MDSKTQTSPFADSESYQLQDHHSTQPQQQINTEPNLQPPSTPGSLKVDFSWRKFEGLITDPSSTTSETPTPLYILTFKAITAPHITFTRASDNKVIGTTRVHTFSIHVDCTIHDKPVSLLATSRMKTAYAHSSPNLVSAHADTLNEPMKMTWASNVDLKTWDFTCLDEDMLPVARFKANIWAVKKLGWIEFLGRAQEQGEQGERVREEMVIMANSLFYNMLLRMNNIFQLFGAAFDDIEGKDAGKKKVENGSGGVVEGRKDKQV